MPTRSTPAPTTDVPTHAGLSPVQLEACRSAFAADPSHRLAMNACSAGNIDEIALSREAVATVDWTFSHEVAGGAITHQRQAGFCWLYAALNWLRVGVMDKLGVENFEFSQNYLIFWDRLEKANRFLAAMVRLRERAPDDRLVDFMLREPCPDGGEWHMVANLIRKYGLVPKSAMNDTANLADSKYLNKIVDAKLRQTAARIFALHRTGASEAAVWQAKQEAMVEVYKLLAIMMGEPPQRFDFTYRDKDKRFHAHRDLTPAAFYDRFVGRDLGAYVWLMSSPLEDTPYDRTFVVDHFQNVVEGAPGTFLNVPMTTLKALAVKALKAGEAVFFGCDVLQDASRKQGLLDPGVLDYELLFGTSFEMSRAERFRFLQSRLTHDMVFLGVDLVDDQARKWKVENSWGDDVGHKGYFQMSDAWFDEHVYAIVVERRFLDARLRKQLTQEPVVLPPWHPLA
jgi:bleomycin hydrolase